MAVSSTPRIGMLDPINISTFFSPSERENLRMSIPPALLPAYIEVASDFIPIIEKEMAPILEKWRICIVASMKKNLFQKKLVSESSIDSKVLSIMLSAFKRQFGLLACDIYEYGAMRPNLIRKDLFPKGRPFCVRVAWGPKSPLYCAVREKMQTETPGEKACSSTQTASFSEAELTARLEAAEKEHQNHINDIIRSFGTIGQAGCS